MYIEHVLSNIYRISNIEYQISYIEYQISYIESWSSGFCEEQAKPHLWTNCASQCARSQTAVNPLRAVKTNLHRMHASLLSAAVQPQLLICLHQRRETRRLSTVDHGQCWKIKAKGKAGDQKSERVGEHHVEWITLD